MLPFPTDCSPWGKVFCVSAHLLFYESLTDGPAVPLSRFACGPECRNRTGERKNESRPRKNTSCFRFRLFRAEKRETRPCRPASPCFYYKDNMFFPESKSGLRIVNKTHPLQPAFSCGGGVLRHGRDACRGRGGNGPIPPHPVRCSAGRENRCRDISARAAP